MTAGARARRAIPLSATLLATGAIAGAVLAPMRAPASAPPSTDPGVSATTTLPPSTFENGVFTAPDGSFTASFAHAPGGGIDIETGIASYIARVDEDTQSVVVFPPTALGATANSTTVERVELFLAASGTRIETLANTPTSLGPYPASHFAARLTLAEGRRSVVYGLVVDRGADIVYAFYTDVGDDDNAPGTAFVQSFAIVMNHPPAPTTSTTTTTPTTSAAPSTDEAASEPPTDDSGTTPPATESTAPPPTTSPPPSTVAAAPDGSLLGFDGRWWIGYPERVVPTFRASTEDGYAFAEYLAVDGDDTLVVRVTAVPLGFEWDAEAVPAAAADGIGGAVLDSTVTQVGGHPAVRFTLAQDDSDTSGDTVQVLVVDGGDQIYTVSFEDGGATSSSDADTFLASFGLA